ncbi:MULTISPECIES: helix-turn-helix transcriptional regulator [Kordiimonas]|jgi:AraC-like DNA-binding protein|uniref:AraC-type DNA-binding protein n=1 Tax=Kordiimonas lacus TaxID=637679 RepID=A0A1G6SX81_9PROT|nr:MULTISPECIES: helix-turn-helix transcriptional regulator [Kordiimonas]SDD21389.1 AraC-type DNA-binding protein [Kordiimonas lacus]
MHWELLDNVFRYGAICNLFWVCFLAARNHSNLAHTYIVIPAMASGICWLITGAYDEIALFGPFGYVLGFMARMVVVLNWLFTINVLSDSFRLGPFYIAVLVVYALRALAFQLDIVPHDLFAQISHPMRIGLYLFLIYKVLSDMPGDLLEKRRRFRIWFMVGHVLITAALTLERMYVSNALYGDNISLTESFAVFLLSSYFLFHSIRPEEKNPFESDYRNARSESTETLPELQAADRHNLEILKQKMDEGLYREPGLTVAELAKSIDVQEHRLRKLINMHLGHRNISQFLNDYRIDEAKKRLADVSERHVPILTIAMDVGYLSLRPFNRAFKNRTNQTPSEYREQHLAAQTSSSDAAPLEKMPG